MLKKCLNILLKVIYIIIIYILQLYLFNNVMIFGVKTSLPLMLISVICLASSKHMSYICNASCGILCDILFSKTIGKYLLIYMIITVILANVKRIYNRDSKFSVVIYGLIATVINEILLCMFNVFNTSEYINIFGIVWVIFKTCIINIFFIYFIYIIWNKVLDKVKERE